MEKYERLSEEETYWWIPFKFLDQILKAILKCLGLLHHDSPSTKTESSPVTSNQPEEEEEEDVVMAENATITSTGSKIVVTSRGTKMKAKPRKKEEKSTGRSGKHHKYDL
ncbi:precursor of elicitor peptide 1 isoform X2 [Raphanus sativus]|uniref:Precursor of elicitor peptide 1 isoform X2 n=1 Tax=Raphanus sativus TaxID=3726 RepID=A0A9W3BU76_RAPSA|nr:PREDICTED: elicitor peptide 1-like [Raphanus sativus]XP_056842793.1 precursor of elicitor peptide 1 isoform X2 [Raphanus sativus]